MGCSWYCPIGSFLRKYSISGVKSPKGVLGTSHGRLANPLQAEDLGLLRERVVATHIFDNLGMRDDHLYPYRGSIDGPEIIDLLKGAPCAFNFEVPGERACCPVGLRDALVEYGYAVGAYLLELF